MQYRSTYPRPEYPRPDRQRGLLEGVDWLNLNGPWDFRFDGERTGIEEHWFEPQAAAAKSIWREQIIVPFCWESLAAWGEGDAAGNDNYYATRVFRNPLEVTRENHRSAARYEVGWYRREVLLPNGPAWQDKRAILTIGAADFFTDCWCNGVHLGRHEGGYTPFEFDLTEALLSTPEGRRATLVLRVEDPMDNHEQPVGKQWSWYTTTSGIWQTVFIEPRDARHIESFRITPDIDTGTVDFQFVCRNCEAGSIEIEITPPDEDPPAENPIRATLPLAGDKPEIRIPISPLLLWGPNHPYLYRTTLRLMCNDQVIDTVHTYFGMRKIDAVVNENPAEGVALRLNNKLRYLRGALHQSYYPDGVYTAGDARTLRNDIAYAMKVGFNFLRIHIKIDDPLLLYYADEMGMLLMCDFPNFGEGGDTPLGRQRYETMMEEAIERDFNHPSIFAWCLFNETWGFGGQVELVKHFNQKKEIAAPARAPDIREEAPSSAVSALAPPHGEHNAESVAVGSGKLSNRGALDWVQEIWQRAKKLDRTRLIEDMSVVPWEHLDYYAHGDTDINSWHFYINDYTQAKAHIDQVVKDTYSGSSFNFVEGYAQGIQPLINSEYGGVGALDGNRDVSWSFKFLTNEMRRHGKISAYIYTELHDVEWEYNGFLRYDRTTKEFGYDPTIINAADVLPVDAPPIARVVTGSIVRVPVSSSHYSTHIRENVSLRWRLYGMDSYGRLYTELERGLVPIEFPNQRVAPAHVIEVRMPDTTMHCTLDFEAITPEGEVVARNYVEFLATPGYPPDREEFERCLVLRGAPWQWDTESWSGGYSDREDARIQDRCFGRGTGYFEWSIPLNGADLWSARCLRVLCEASARREGTHQTDAIVHPTTLHMSLNGILIYGAKVPDHPHDARGSLSYLRGEDRRQGDRRHADDFDNGLSRQAEAVGEEERREEERCEEERREVERRETERREGERREAERRPDGKGAHGYLAHASAEGDLLRQIAERAGDGYLRFRCEVPPNATDARGLTIYGAECGRYPVAPTIAIEW